MISQLISLIFEWSVIVLFGAIAVLLMITWAITIVGGPIFFLIAVIKAIAHGWPAGADVIPPEEQMRPPDYL